MKSTILKRECINEHSQNLFIWSFFFAALHISCRHFTWQRVENSAVLSFIWVFGLQCAQQNTGWLAFCHLQIETKKNRCQKNTILYTFPCQPLCLVVSCYLYDETFARQAVCVHGVVVVFIEDGDEGCACGAARGGTPIMNQHRQLVTRLLLSVQNSPSTDFTWRQKSMGKWMDLNACRPVIQKYHWVCPYTFGRKLSVRNS